MAYTGLYSSTLDQPHQAATTPQNHATKHPTKTTCTVLRSEPHKRPTWAATLPKNTFRHIGPPTGATSSLFNHTTTHLWHAKVYELCSSYSPNITSGGPRRAHKGGKRRLLRAFSGHLEKIFACGARIKNHKTTFKCAFQGVCGAPGHVRRIPGPNRRLFRAFNRLCIFSKARSKTRRKFFDLDGARAAQNFFCFLKMFFSGLFGHPQGCSPLWHIRTAAHTRTHTPKQPKRTHTTITRIYKTLTPTHPNKHEPLAKYL